MKTLLLICSICVSVSSLAEVKIYSDVGQGPFKGYEFELSYSEDDGICFEEKETSDGPVKGGGYEKEVSIEKCSLFIKAIEEVNQNGKCDKKRKILSSSRSGPLKYGQTILKQTKGCECIKIVKGSYGPFKGYEHQYLVDRNECLSNLEETDKK